VTYVSEQPSCSQWWRARDFDGTRSATPHNARTIAGRRRRGVQACRYELGGHQRHREAAGVAQSTFYFHFPTKEHVLLELIRRDEDYLARSSVDFSIPAVISRRYWTRSSGSWWRLRSAGVQAYSATLSVSTFSPGRPANEDWSKHPTFVLLAAEIERARNRGELYDDVDAYHSAAFFLIGLHAQLISAKESGSERDETLRKFVKSTLRSLQR
jgi:AcrR family transcriptional regulator